MTIQKAQPEYALDRIIVKYKAPLATNDTGMFNLRADYQVNGVGISRSKIINPALENQANSLTTNLRQNTIEVVEPAEPGAEAVERATKQFEMLENVEYAEKCYLLKFAKHQSNPLNTIDPCCLYGLNKIEAPQAWSITQGDSEVVVGVIDTGVDIKHPAIRNNLWINPNPGSAGYENDVHGYDFVHQMGYDGRSTASDDPTGHGTHIAGTIAGNAFASCPGVGIAPNVKIAVIKVSHLEEGDTATAIEGINYANNMGIPITNNSYYGLQESRAFRETIENGGLYIACAGNTAIDIDDTPQYPASFNCENMISVAATDHQDMLAEFSCYGAESVDLAAPGVQIYSLLPYLNTAFGVGVPDYVFNCVTMSGTSMAAPHVSGAAALVLSALLASDAYAGITLNSERYMDLLLEVKKRILNNTDPIPELMGKVKTGGRLNVYKALTNSEQ